MKRIKGIFSLTILLITFFPAALAAQSADSKENPWERFSLSLGGFAATMNSSVVLGAKELGTGLAIDVEDALNLDSSLTVFRGDAFVRLGDNKRHRLDFSYYDLRRHATRTLQKDLDIGGNTYPVGATVDSSLDFQIIKGGYSYSLLQDNRVDIALGLGVFVMPIKFEINAAGVRSTSESITAPLPFVHFRADVALTPKFFLRQTYEFFYMQVNNFQGSLFNGLLALEYNPWKHIGFGAGYNVFRVFLKASGGDYPNINFTGSMQLDFSGLMLYAKTFF
jgi:hypothetical protein